MVEAQVHDGVMARLKAETAERHRSAETRDFQRRLVRGELGAADYTRWLGQMLVLHRALEARLREASASDRRVAAVVTAEQYKERLLAEDLAHFQSPEPGAGPSVAAFLHRIADASTAELMGMHYVLEGSNNGNRFIAKAVRRALGLAEGAGDRYLDPYGDSQREQWAIFKTRMDAAGWSAEEADLMVRAAQDTFDAIGALSEELQAGA